LGTEALRLLEEVDDRLGEGKAHRILGRVAFQRGAYWDSLEECMRALYLIGDRDDFRLLGGLAIELVNAFYHLGAEVQDVAIAWYERPGERLLRACDWVELT